MPNLGSTEILVVVGVLLALFAVKQIPGLISGIAKAIKEFRSASK
ncbi:MAG: Sec-independent protein translocase protein TatA [Candidatus Collierbacteria bacterium GW2011_GWC1_45_47]|uniref:Sec-independent protein translocase protein TatA n=4 Tax=Candidatus Collieribacteriota TaxID=1752725 RepID=A0A0G1HG81_9BACT|nr:MAG: Sec-independent protein translocase protein TatA [Candidatus Collierbacteria bacterium GW2011_GWA1_44_12]KKT37770.1 MAG: Sec-independent protein translocase protein TatA [Candidatus Collierbacteria bacterium GW2011_GWF1_44_12]KKT45900.1 MAG: Sec-independent protein translocase protein TatA [Candidatus Collierbacteria bacterium GW2011_GWF2_44_15]KKU08811.1 MAG: Sec-independent protein translocase protein TatA [Candidatus Collierbacteria bacterium GW2011_GWC1_45_47]KKU27457.1 MAG: Sec-ind